MDHTLLGLLMICVVVGLALLNRARPTQTTEQQGVASTERRGRKDVSAVTAADTAHEGSPKLVP
jgi:hypothetical protein